MIRVIVVVYLGLVGAAIGSFLGVVFHRVPRGESLLGRSRCASCGTPIPPHRNVPIVSWLALRGRAACCGARIPVSVLIPEIVTALIWIVPSALPLPLWLQVVLVVGGTVGYAATGLLRARRVI